MVPVADIPLYRIFEDPDHKLEDLDLLGANTYACFDKAIVLDQQMRQTGDDQSLFRQMLCRIRQGSV